MPGPRVDSNRDCLSICCIYDGGFAGAVKDVLKGPLDRGEKVLCIANPEKAISVQKQFAVAPGTFPPNLMLKSPYSDHCANPVQLAEFVSALCSFGGEVTACVEMSSLPGTLCSADTLADFSFRFFALKRCNIVAAFERKLFPPAFLLKILRFYPFLLINGVLCRNVGGQELFDVSDPDLESEELLSTCLEAIERGAKLADQCFPLPLPPRLVSVRFKGRILLADDNAFSRRVMAGRLKALGYAVEEASGGEEAVSFALEKRYSLILMDCNMPGLDGFAASMKIREEEEEYYTPIVALTADDSPADCRRCLLSGMDRLLSKGEVSVALNALLDELSPVVRMRSLDMVREAFEGNIPLLRDYFLSLLKNASQQAGAMREAVARGDGSSLRMSAHALRGSSLTIGMRNMGLLCARLEAMGGDGLLSGAEGLLKRLDAEIKSAGSFLENYLSRLTACK